MKPILTIFLFFSFFHSFAQDDSMLQRLIDSAKTATPSQKPPVVKKDTVKRIIPPPVRIDSVLANRYTTDTLFLADTTLIPADSTLRDSIIPALSVVTKKSLTWQEDTAFMNLLKIPYIKKDIQPLLQEGNLRVPANKDYLFYTLVAIVLLLAFIKQAFPKYFSNLFRLLIDASFRQKQRREQLMQETLASLMMNILFIITGGMFIALLAVYYHWLHITFWLLALYCITVLFIIYIVKYLVILFTGWVFNVREPASTYSFIVFLINKIVGVVLLPLLLLLAFSNGQVWDITVTIATAVVTLLLVFRYIISLSLLRGALNIHPFHFFLYLCAVELMPMLVIYKLVFNITGKSSQ